MGSSLDAGEVNEFSVKDAKGYGRSVTGLVTKSILGEVLHSKGRTQSIT